jgi:5-methylthioadenosine/S-adenosylhomocysteine deaminase
LTTHFSESAHEAAYMHDGSGPWAEIADLLVPPLGTSGIRALAERGLLGPRVVAAHCVTVDAEEIALLREHDVAVAHCPRSNGYLGCGVAPLAELRAAGLRVSVATDSPASTPGFDMFEELRAAVTAARARAADAGALSAGDALELATLAGARVLGLEHEIGSLVPNKWADLVVIDLDGSPFDPVEDPSAAAVLGGSPDRVLATLVGGVERYRKGTTEWRDLRSRARSARSRMLR